MSGAIFGGMVVIGFCIYHGLGQIADAIRDRVVTVRFEGPANITLKSEEQSDLLDALEQAVAFMDGQSTPVNALVNARAILAKHGRQS